MIRYKTFYSHIDDRELHDSDVRQFIHDLCNAGHSFVNVQTVMYNNTTDHKLNRMRTEIVYQENPKREVITEKIESKKEEE